MLQAPNSMVKKEEMNMITYTLNIYLCINLALSMLYNYISIHNICILSILGVHEGLHPLINNHCKYEGMYI